jgi:hypothetical protein
MYFAKPEYFIILFKMVEKMRIGIWFILLLLPSFNFAQIKSVRLDEATATNQVCQPAIVINKKNPNNIIAASSLDNIYFTLDGGGTWQSLKIKSSGGVNGDPVLVSDDKGNIFAFHLSDPSGEGPANERFMNQILCHISKDGGKTWEEGAAFGTVQKDNTNPWATVDSKGNVWVAWTQLDKYKSDDENCQSNILLTSSANGKKWSKPLQIAQTPGNCKDDDNTAIGAMPAFTLDGKAFVAWANQNKLFLDRSFNGGGLWLTNDIAVVNQPGGWDLTIPGHSRSCGRPVLMIDQSKSIFQGSLYMTWADQRNGESDTDVWFIRSTNFGDNWSAPIKLGDDENKRHQYLPWMTVDQTTGYIYVIFYDRAPYDDNQTDVCLAYSIDGGLNFKTVKLSESPFTPMDSQLFGNYINISAHKGVITPIWTRLDDGKTSIWTSIIKQADLIQVPQAARSKKKK